MSKKDRKSDPTERTSGGSTGRRPRARKSYSEPSIGESTSDDPPPSSESIFTAAAAGAVDKNPQESPASAGGIDQFDEAYYTARYRDVAEAIAGGVWHNGLMHYAMSGRASGRVACPKVDESWYESAYPMAIHDIAAGRASSFADHYHRVGRYRGYLPAQRAARPDDPAKCRSRYGGLWTDCGDALDLIDGRADLGLLTAENAHRLRQWVTDGFVVIPRAVPGDMIDRALEFLERAFVGEHPKLLFEIQGHGRADPRAPEARGNPGKVLDPHWHSVAVRNVIFAPGLLEFLHLIFERRVMASQTLGFVRGWQQGGHQDSAYVNYSLPMQFAACWIALEDVKEGAGEVFYHVGSHRIGEYRFHNRFKGVSEAQRLGFSETVTEAQTAQHAARISEQVKGLGLPARTYRAKRGDVLIWSADLVHGCGASFGQVSSKHLLAHYCPAESAPWYFERGICQIRKHGEEFYSSGHYEK